MPELPEVEVVRRGLESHLCGATFTTVAVQHPRAVRSQVGGAEELSFLLDASRVDAVHRRGKYLWLELSAGDKRRALLVHLGMSGQMLVTKKPAQADTLLATVADPHVRIRATLQPPAGGAESIELNFVDQRTFGGWQVVDLVADPHEQFAAIPTPIAHTAQDPLEPGFDVQKIGRAMRAKRTEIKRALLDQNLVSGIGNIYADEALWAAQLRPTRRTRGLQQGEAIRLLTAAQDVMVRALDAGGTSFDALYVNVEGQSGYFGRALNVYGRQGQECPRCGGTIQRTKFTNRSSHWCPGCQK